MSENQRCAIFYVSDGTAITAETVGRSLITQFTGIDFIEKRLPFIFCHHFHFRCSADLPDTPGH